MARLNRRGRSARALGAEGLELRRLLSVTAPIVAAHVQAHAAQGDDDAGEPAPIAESPIHRARAETSAPLAADADVARDRVALADTDDGSESDAEAPSPRAEETPYLAVVGDPTPQADPTPDSTPESARRDFPASASPAAGQPPAALAPQPIVTRVASSEERGERPVPDLNADPPGRAGEVPAEVDQIAKEASPEPGASEGPDDPLALVQPIGSPLVASLVDRALSSFDDHVLGPLGGSWSDAYRLSVLAAGALFVGSVVVYRRLHTPDHDQSLTRAAVARALVPGLWPLRSP